MKINRSWRSDRLGQEVNVARWGEVGVPFLMFPTAGGDAEEIERFLVIDTVADFLTDGRLKVYSCDSVAGRVMLGGEGTPEHRMTVLNRFQEFVYREFVPMIREDCNDPGIEVIVAGSSIGAFNALAMVCRFPDAFSHALCMSGTYDLQRFLKHETGIEASATGDFYRASPVHHLPQLAGETLDRLRERFVLLASGRGRAEDIGESWRAASLLGRKGVPNRMDDWGEEWHHDWPTWRHMLLRYLDELLPARPSSPRDARSAGT